MSALAPMVRAFELAACGLYTTDPNPRVGCVLVRDGTVIGEGWHVRAGEGHAEIRALLDAGGAAAGATAYVTLEPCNHTGRTGPCADALIAAGVERVVCAAVDPNPRVAGAGIRRLEAAGVTVTMAPFEADARRLNPGFFSRFERSRPFVRLKMAMSLDARTAAAVATEVPTPHQGLTRRPDRWISDAASRADVQTLRARSSAVLTGAGTILADDPRLDVRLAYGDWVRQPLRVVLDSDRRCTRDANVFKDEHALRFVAEDTEEHADGVRTLRLPRARQGLDLDVAMHKLAELEVNELFVECGPRLAGSFLEADLVDELILYVAPHFLGCDAPPLAAILGANRAVPLPRFEFQDHRLIEQDLRLVLSRKTHG